MLEQNLTAGVNKALPSSFIGEVAGADFITAAALTTLVGMDGIGSLTNASVSWLKYTYKGKTTYLAKKVLRHAMTWEQLHARGIARGTQTFTIQGKLHTVRIPTGYASPPVTNYDVSTGGEFNDLIYPVYVGVSSDHPYVKAYPRWASFSDADLGLITNYLESGTVPGALTWVQDLRADGAVHMVRGYNDSDKAHQLTAGWGVALNATQNYAGWRPIIEEV